APSPAELRSYLRERLPDYLVPDAFVALPALPLTAHGKLDRQALPDPKGALRARVRSPPPRGPIEEGLAGIWEDLLAVDRVGADDNFFELGGHSLPTPRVVSQVREAFGVELPLRRLFAAPTVAALAREIAGTARSIAPPLGRVARDQPLPLSFAQQRLWFLDQLEPASSAYNIPAA